MSKWLWPVPGWTGISSGVGPRWGTSHKGIDIPADQGTRVVASSNGKVKKVVNTCTHNIKGKNKENKWLGDNCGGGYGNYIIIDHQDGYETIYAHLTNVSVEEGQFVSLGQPIGTIGTTGHSTGFHLHFEIKLRGVVQDPEKYVTPGGTKAIDIDPNALDVATSDSTDYLGGYVPYSPTSVTPLTSSEFTKGKPMYAMLMIFIGDHLLQYTHGKPSMIQRFEINRLEEAGCKATFTIFDDNWDEIEMYLSDNWDNVHIQYGYADGLLSPKYKMLLTDYTIDFYDTGTVLNIDAISEGIYQNLNQVVSLDTKTKNPTEAIKAICRYMNWNVIDSNFEPTLTVEDRSDTYKLNQVSPITYIQDVIIKEAITSDQEIVMFYLDADDLNTAHLKRKSYGERNSSDLASTDIKTYVYQKGYDSVVESLSFNIKGVFGGTSNLGVTTGLKGSVFGVYDKEESTSESDISSVLTSSTGIYSHTRVNQSIAQFNTSGDSASQMSNKLHYYIKNSTTSQYEATMVIIGDPRIELLEDVRIINLTDAGFLHHTSGIYMVKGISDSIDNGEFKTTLILQRNGDINEGIELRNPKVAIK